MDEPFEIEARGAAAGINPMFGKWYQEFEIEPVSYANPGPVRAAFKQSLRDQLKNKYVFVGEVSFTATLYLNEQKMLETAAYGDLDNYAKLLLDSIKGRGGLLIDDCQVQHLDISWIDVPRGARFELEINTSPDDFLPEPLKLYEMPDSLYYPISTKIWTQSGLMDAKEESIIAKVQALAAMTSVKKQFGINLGRMEFPRFSPFSIAGTFHQSSWASSEPVLKLQTMNL